MLNHNNHNNVNHNNTYEAYHPQSTFNDNNNYALLRKNKQLIKNAPTISHATRIEPTNLTYKDLLRKHQFTPTIKDQKEIDDDSKLNEFHLNHKNIEKQDKLTQLEIERELFRKKAIIEEPKKNISGYQLFAKWKRSEEPDSICPDYPQSKALSIAWNELQQNDRDEWTKKSQEAKIQYIHQKDAWLKYVEEAKFLGIPVPTKSVKPIIQQIKIKNLLNLIPNISKYNKETQFIISKATEMFIQFYASKAIEISSKVSHHEQNTNNGAHYHITAQHCYDALQTEHKFNFLRAVTVKPLSTMKKKRKRTQVNVASSPKKKQKTNNTKTSTNTKTNQIITNHDEFTAYPTGYPGYQYPYHQYPVYGQYPAAYQIPPNPFQNVNVERIQSPNTQIVNVQQIFGGDE